MLRIALTGGPCGGKSRLISLLYQILEERGYNVFTVPESATELILNGIKPCENISTEEFQNFVLDKQLAKEKLYDNTVKYYDSNKIIIIYDRGIMDACAYVDKDAVFKKMLERRGLTFADIYSHYDAVFHLVTAADGAEEFYQWNNPDVENVGNNAARRESPEQAKIKDKTTLNSWIGHPHLRVFDNSTDFDGKMQRVITEIFSLLGEPVPTEIERKFLIKRPTQDEIESLGCVSETNIIQTYLHRNDINTERRIRQRGTKENGFSFFYTEKTNFKSGERIEKERKISQEEYISYLSEADINLHQISKIRYCFIYRGKYFEMDIYPFSDEYAIVEIELNDIDDKIDFPPLNFVKEVTDDRNYQNSSLAKTLSFDIDTEQHERDCAIFKKLQA
jgi:CYTH domain-containing protein/predicted ATPase